MYDYDLEYARVAGFELVWARRRRVGNRMADVEYWRQRALQAEQALREYGVEVVISEDEEGEEEGEEEGGGCCDAGGADGEAKAAVCVDGGRPGRE